MGGDATTKPADVAAAMKSLLMEYNSKSEITLDDVLDFHVRFEAIHPFQDGNGRIGRLILFKECLKHNIVPFIITEELKLYYYKVGVLEFFYPAASFTPARYRSILSTRIKACGVSVSRLSCGVCIRCHVCGMTAANGESGGTCALVMMHRWSA